ncbi:rhodanese-like domain-containing protein [Elusimicrobiota bacterium]
MYKSIHLCLLVSVALVLCGCPYTAPQTSKVKTIDQHTYKAVLAPDLHNSLEQGWNPYIVDVRPQPNYAKGHIPGAISMPFVRIHDRYKELPKYTHIVIYTESSSSPLADEAAKILIRRNFSGGRLYVLVNGYAGWLKEGNPVETQED